MSPEKQTERVDAGTGGSIEDLATRHWSVEVTRNGESLVTIESNCLSGKADFSAEEQQVIRDAGRHLLSFIGNGDVSNF